MTCQTHPALCPGRKCPDSRECKRANGKVLIVSKILSKYHGIGNQGNKSAILGGEVRAPEEKEGRYGPHLGRVDRKDIRNSRRISKNCPPTVAPEGEQVVIQYD